MRDRRDWSDQLMKLIDSVSPEVLDQARDLFEDDPASLRNYVRSETFWDDLMEENGPVEADVDAFFFILFEQFRTRLSENDSFRREFSHSLHQLSDESWEIDRARNFLNDDALVHYLVDMLSEFVQTHNVYQLPIEGDDDEYRYIVDMLKTAVDSGRSETFQIYCHIGNYTLFLTGVFPEWIRYRHEYKNRPMNLDSYTNYGKTYYERAANHSLADRQQLRPVLKKLSMGYDPVRTMINFMFQRMLPAFQ